MWSLDSYRNNIAVVDENGETYTYAYLGYECYKLGYYAKSGRCLVFNLCANEIGSLIGYIAFIDSRIVPLLLDAHLDRGLMKHLIELYKPDYIWLPEYISVEFPRYETVYKSHNYSLIKTEFTRVYPMSSDLALLLTTSGSTGSPKLVRQSYANIKANTDSIVNYLSLNEKERPITTLPMSYTYGLSVINSHLSVGASIILTQKTVMQKEFWQQFKNCMATSIAGVPYIYEMLDRLHFFSMNIPSLKTMTQAGGKLAPELHKKFAEYAKQNGKHFIVMYGQTEATARMSYLPHEKSLEKYGSMGVAIPGGKFSLIDINGNEIKEPEITGELVYEGDNVTLGYAVSGEDLIKGDERHGRLITGDMAKRDSEGYYYIVGRKKRFLKIFGSRINLDETERMIKAKFCDTECACAGIDDKMQVFVTNQSLAQEVQHYLADKTGLNHSAFNIKCIGSIPKNDAGKTLYTELECYYD